MKKLVLAAGLLLAGCDGNSQSVGQIVASIQNTCGYVTTANVIIPVILTVLTSFDPSAGAAATVSTDIAKKVVDSVCDAVKGSQNRQAFAATGSGNAAVVVNGARVPGYLIEK